LPATQPVDANPTVQTPDVVEFQLRQYLMKRVPPLPKPRTAAEWTARAAELRKDLLENVVLRGWPREWIDAPPRFEDLGLIETDGSYRLRKFRYEVVPGFQTTALLYEPKEQRGKVPATINLNGHDPGGTAAPYKQKRCINNALQGIFALSLEWIGMGEMAGRENDHWNGAHLNLVGVSATGLHYLAIRRGLDFLCAHSAVDSKRIGVTGLSGGAWQTIMIAALDERVAAAVPIAGYFSFTSAIERNSDVGDMEYHPHDLFQRGGDYSTLTAMLAPRPALLIYGAVDEFGLRSALQRPHLYDEVKPFYKLYGSEENFAWHDNVDPGTHNDELDNRQKSYAFFTKHFGMPVVEREVAVDREVKTREQLNVGVPKDNLTILGLAKRLASDIRRTPVPPDAMRKRLTEVLRYKPVTVKRAWPVYSARKKDGQALGQWLEFEDGLCATAVDVRSTASPDDAPVVIVLNDDGVQTVRPKTRANAGQSQAPAESPQGMVDRHISAGSRVLAVNLLFTGDASPDRPKDRPPHVPEQYRESFPPAVLADVMKWLTETRPPSALYSLLLGCTGERPLGIRAAQLLGIARWLRDAEAASLALETTGVRSQVSALVAGALEPRTFSSIKTNGGLKSLRQLIDDAVRFQTAPELFCLDLFKEFDIDTLTALTTTNP
jgi:dienelactone hydrolase